MGLGACATQTDASTSAGTGEGAAVEPRGTGSADAAKGGDAAVWFLGPDAKLEPSTTTFTALVSRLGCTGGDTGEVLAPDIRMDGSEIVLTFQVAPKQLGPGGATCPGNESVPYEVALPEPLRDRTLTDGQCLAGGEVATTSDCQPDATRFTPT
jgi:hypothetical protein